MQLRSIIDDACLSHGSDAVIFCGASSVGAFPDGELRLVGPTGAPALPKEAGRLEVFLGDFSNLWAPVCKLGFTSGSASVACKQMGYTGAAGFAGCRSREACGGVAPQLADLACAGSETNVLQCPLCQSGTTCSVRQKSLCFCLVLDMVTRLENRQLLKRKPLAVASCAGSHPCCARSNQRCCWSLKRNL